ncbi:MAG: hypothetical protein WDM79_02060 [Terricaulis sp.]
MIEDDVPRWPNDLKWPADADEFARFLRAADAACSVLVTKGGGNNG